ncbi:MAG: 6-hydroxymethylpterin diphosphokinase MptE-like protein, partial [Candidatus Thermoplasmatota archaeon]|nr:6-hydroxymethylpterin diphosphokinase MptE-like protein [Candidatus Thermoplasmatota archaeon]
MIDVPGAQAHYEVARERLGLDPQQDAEAAWHLARLLHERRDLLQVRDPTTLKPQFQSRPCAVLAPGQGGIQQVQALPSGTPLIVAGSAVARARDHDLTPRLVVTDLDGDPGAHLTLSRWGATTAIHAHGDNTQLIDELVPRFQGPVLATCQTTPPKDAPAPVHRFGGFTDGDRAVWLAAWLGASEVWLAGWDLEEEGVDGVKREKLAIAGEM